MYTLLLKYLWQIKDSINNSNNNKIIHFYFIELEVLGYKIRLKFFTKKCAHCFDKSYGSLNRMCLLLFSSKSYTLT